MKTVFCFFFFLGAALCDSCFSQENTQVFFLEVKNAKGETVVLEPGFPYAHMAISIEPEFILHAHPQTGVQKISSSQLSQFGEVKEVIELELDLGGIQEDLAVHQILGKPYDFGYSWDNGRFYCSELVAKILGIAPEPMHFDPELWPPSFWSLEGKPGISPGKIYQKLKTEAFLFKKTR